MIRTTLADKPEQFQDGEAWHVGRRVLYDKSREVFECFPDKTGAYTETCCVLFQLDYDKGLIFVDPSILRPYPSEPIEEPKT